MAVRALFRSYIACKSPKMRQRFLLPASARNGIGEA